MVPSSTSSPDELGLEDGPVNTYSKYLNPKPTPAAPVVMGVKRKMVHRNISSGIKPPPKLLQQPIEDGLDLSQHSIIPNASYIAHLSKQRPYASSSSSEEESHLEFHDANSDVSEPPSPSSVSSSSEEIFEDTILFDNVQETNVEEIPPIVVDEPKKTGFWKSLFKSFTKL